MDAPDLTPNELFEQRAEQFYRDTGVMAPGKDEAMLGGHTPYEVRTTLWEYWCKVQREKAAHHNAVVEAAAKVICIGCEKGWPFINDENRHVIPPPDRRCGAILFCLSWKLRATLALKVKENKLC